ncbi:MAG TPA: DUF929 family protein [Acidimicrobiales bacterium]|nr:DUF929 family protein [Acidimicrobiales bacterium]
MLAWWPPCSWSPGTSGWPPTRSTDQGRPAVVYVGGEFCPYCAVQRWALVVALSRFGTFADLGRVISSSSTDIYPDLQSWSFHGSTYSSPYLTFDLAEIYSDTANPATGVAEGYTSLDALSPLQAQAFDTYDAPHTPAVVPAASPSWTSATATWPTGRAPRRPRSKGSAATRSGPGWTPFQSGGPGRRRHGQLPDRRPVCRHRPAPPADLQLADSDPGRTRAGRQPSRK